jgi:glycosyltransferase involved in cell wall biosynthesis
MKKIYVCFFLRKAVYGENYSLEKYYRELFTNHHNKNFVFNLKICPVTSTNIFNRIYLIFWAYFQQGDINHICGDINFISTLLNKKKTIVTIADNYSMIRLKGLKKLLYYIFWLKLPLFNCARIISISSKTSKEILKYFPQYKKKIVKIDICIQKIFKKNLRKIMNIPKILIIGTAANKNFYNSILAISKINCEVLIVGKLDEQKFFFLKKLKVKYSNYLNLSDHEVYKVYCKSDILLFASMYEGFGMPILEAQAVGRPVITSNINPLTYVGGKGALFVNPNSIKSITKFVKSLIKNNFLRKKLIRNGFENIKRFNIKSILQQHYNCYNEIINNQ